MQGVSGTDKQELTEANRQDLTKQNFINKYTALLFAVVFSAALLIVRVSLFYHEWGDYTYFLQPWLATYRTMTFWEGLGTVVGNYNPPYMYLLNIISRINLPELVLIKSVSVFCDFLIAFFVMKIVSLRTKSYYIRLLAFVLTLAIPNVILNSSMWGQCDAVYSAFAIGAVYFGLKERSRLVYVFFALAFSFKMQAAFLMPMIPVFIFMKKIRIKDCYWFFIVYFATLLPAIFAGMPVGTVLATYTNQADTYSWLSINIANVWSFTRNLPYEHFVTAGLFVAGSAILGLLCFTWVNRKRLVDTADFVRLAYLFSVLMVFLLPKMHDRYYFLADLLSLLVFLFDKRRWFVPVISIFCSYISYAWFLMGAFEVIDFRIAAFAMLFVIIVVLRDYVKSLSNVRKEC